MELSDFDIHTFDCYGTLIDWETGIIQALRPWLIKNNKKFTDDTILEAYAKYESQQQTLTPSMPYPSILFNVHQLLAKEWNIKVTDEQANEFGQSVKCWPVFSDSHEALKSWENITK